MVAPSNRSSAPDLSSSSARDSSPSSSSESSSPAIGPENETALPSRYILPRNFDSAIRQLPDQELDRLVSAALEERARRKKPPVPEESRRKRSADAVALSLPQGKLNAIRAAFKAGVTPSRIAREFGISQQDVRGVLTGDARKQ
jgi:hypothetical protein